VVCQKENASSASPATASASAPSSAASASAGGAPAGASASGSGAASAAGAAGSGGAERTLSKESQNRYSRTAKDWGWREFISLTQLFDADAGYLVNDTVIFTADVLILKESTELRPGAPAGDLLSLPPSAALRLLQLAG